MDSMIGSGGAVTFAVGYKAAGVSCGVKSSGKLDLAAVVSDTPASAAALFTSSSVVAAPVVVSRERLALSGSCQAIVINSGNANACTGRLGLEDAGLMADKLADCLGVEPNLCLVASTGIIGERLPIAAILEGIGAVAEAASHVGGHSAAQAILTTDAFTKEAVAEIEIGGSPVRIGGMAKGAGMIAPRLVPHATMIAVITTDAAASPEFLRKALEQAVAVSFNACSVDGDTSTNDTVLLLANGASRAPELGGSGDEEAAELFSASLTRVCTELAKMMVKDGEGSTKVITYTVTGAANDEEAGLAAAAMAKSLLVKTAFHGEDPNWGRLLAAAGYSGARLDINKIQLHIGGVGLIKDGEPQASNLAAAAEVMRADDIEVFLELGIGSGAGVFYGCDLSHEYVRINSEYHT